MKNILLVSTTSGNNYNLAKEIDSLLKTKDVNYEFIKLDDFSLPLYHPKIEKTTQCEDISKLDELFQHTDGFIFCAPEYNGSIPPILSNLIAWLSISGDDFRNLFNGQPIAIATFSGGPGIELITSLRIQLAHLGAQVVGRHLSANYNKPVEQKTIEDIIKRLIQMKRLDLNK